MLGRLQKRSAGFTIVELVIVIGILAVLIAILVPAINLAYVSSRRLQDVSNIQQIVAASLDYAAENNAYLPQGSSSPVPGSFDDAAFWVNYDTFGYFLGRIVGPGVSAQWLAGQPLDEKYVKKFECTSMADLDGIDNRVVGVQSGAAATYMGYVYWGRRSTSVCGPIYNNAGNLVSPAQNYVFTSRLNVPGTSKTLITCSAYVTAASWPSWLMHAGPSDSAIMYGTPQSSPACAVSQKMNGIGIGYTDGSARFVPRSELQAMLESTEPDWLYYDPGK